MLQLNAVSLWYDQLEAPVVYHCDLDVDLGEFVAIVGESGSGKTTLLRLASGLLRPTQSTSRSGPRWEGNVTFRGKELMGPDLAFGYVPQNFSTGLYPPADARKNILMAVWEDGLNQDEKRLAEHLLKMSGLSDVANLNVRRLSGGQQQRVAICRALIKRPSVLFMDEPFANLDSTLRPGMARLLRDVRARDNLAVVFVTHDIEGAVGLANVVLGVRRGYGRPEYRKWNVDGVSIAALRAEIERWINGENTRNTGSSC